MENIRLFSFETPSCISVIIWNFANLLLLKSYQTVFIQLIYYLLEFKFSGLLGLPYRALNLSLNAKLLGRMSVGTQVIGNE